MRTRGLDEMITMMIFLRNMDYYDAMIAAIPVIN